MKYKRLRNAVVDMIYGIIWTALKLCKNLSPNKINNSGMLVEVNNALILNVKRIVEASNHFSFELIVLGCV